jgi:ATP-dependent exoDNAse (exonuclease V) alpha subunit
VLVVDEAGGVPTRLMEQALRLAEQAGTRVVLMGDTGQTKAIEAGRPFAQLQVAGMSTARMEEIERQKAAVLKAAVELAAHGDARGSLAKIETVREIKDSHHTKKALV